MDFQDCIKFVNENPVCCIGTMDGDQPRVRMFELWFADEEGFYFHTATSKKVTMQLKNNPKVELCFYSTQGPANVGTMMRVTGEVKFIGDLELKVKLFEEKPFLKALGIEKLEDPLLTVFHIYKGEAYFWTMDNNMKEAQVEKIKF